MIRTEYSQSLEVRQRTWEDGPVEYTAVLTLPDLDVRAKGHTHEQALARLAIQLGKALAERITGTLTMYS